MKPYYIAPSILSADFARLGDEAQAVLKAGADLIHFDVMDNHYVPNLTIGPAICLSLREFGITADIDVHLMVKPVDAMIEAFAKAGATFITFHPDASPDPQKSLDLIHSLGCKAGLALNPDKPLAEITPFLNELDLILIMSVYPGFGGQAFIPESIQKISAARALIHHHPHIRLSVDGGIKQDNIVDVAKAGANMFVAGSAIYGEKDYAKVIQTMREGLELC